jgi:hypothetical protein
MLRNLCSLVQHRAGMLSLLTYFMIAGVALLWVLSLLHSVLDRSAPKPSVVTETPRVFVKNERRVEETAQQAAAKGETVAPPAEAVVSVTQRAEPVAPVQAEPVQASEPASVAAATSADNAAARAEHLARKKIKAERARKQRLARERARAQEQAAASREQNQLQYGNAQPTFGPFGGWGQPQR